MSHTLLPSLERTATRAVADVLLAFGRTAPAPARQGPDTAWALDAADDAWRLQSAATAAGWKGVPVRTLSAGRHRAWLLGELYGIDAPAVPALVEALCEDRCGGETLNGHFLLLAWTPHERAWRVWTSRFGTLHAYHAFDGERAAIGTCARTVAAAASARALDWEALTGFFACGFFPADRTHYRDLRVLAPATAYRFDETGRMASARRYTQWEHVPEAGRAHRHTVDDFADVFHAVMDDHAALGGRLAVPISGGLDSRSTVAALTRDGASHGAPLWAYSYGYTTDSVETRIARRIGRARGLPLTAHTVGPYLFDRLPDALGATEGFQDVTQHRQTSMVGELAANADAVVAAHWGDVWLDDMGAADSLDEAGLVELALGKMQKRGRAWLLETLCRPHVGEATDAVTRGFVEDGFAPLARLAEPDFRLKVFKTERWSFRWTLASLRAFQPGAFPRLPFYDARLVDFMTTVPTESVRGRRLQIDYLRRHAPDLARVTWQAREANLYMLPLARAWRYPRSAVRRAWWRARGTRPLERNWEVQFAGAAGRAGLRQWLLEPGLALHDLVAPSRVAALLDDFHARPTGASGYTVSMLLTFSAWLELHHHA